MCGICGFVSKNTITAEQLKLMNDAMYHRGTDDSGEEIYPAKNGYYVGFAQRRLSILDLYALGHQPMHSADKRVSVVFNGEIYNMNELKEELLSEGASFETTSYTEVILTGYMLHGK